MKEKKENFIASVKKRQMLAAYKVKMSASIKKTNRNICDISSTKRVKTRKFHVVIVQNTGKEMSQKKCAASAKLFFAN